MLVKVKRIALCKNWNPLSPQQVKAYLIHKKYPIPKHRTQRNKDGERADTTNEESLLELLREGKPAFGDKVVEGTLHAKHLSKAKGYLSDKYIIKDRMHPIYTVKPKSGRLSAARPAIMTLPKGKKGEVMKRASKAILSSIIAEPGYTLFSADWRAIEPTLIGYFAQDPEYARVATLGSHAYTLSHYLGNPVDLAREDALVLADLDALKESHKDDYKMVKNANMAYLYLQGVMNMAKTLGLSTERTKTIRAAIDLSAPKIKKWKIDTLKLAHFQGRLTNPFGFTMTYFDIFKTEYGKVLVGRDGVPILGREAPEAISFPAQSTGAAMLRKVLVDLGNHSEEGLCFQLLIPEHDKIVGQVKVEHLDRILGTLVVPSMERSWPELGGLKIGVDVEVGPSMQVMETWRKSA